MKLKLRADAKDLIIFGIFSLILLYVIALTISNVGTFLREQEFCGLNPFPAFQYNFLLTIMIWIVIMAVLFLSVQTNFFERESGIGFEVGAKKEKNYSRWAKKKEIERGLDVVAVDPKADKASAAGIPLIMNKQKVFVDNGGYHNLVIGSTGAGKTQTTVLPMVNLLAKHDESMVITDPKGEIYEATSEYLKSLGYNIVLLNFRDPQQGNSWNPMHLPHTLYLNGNSDKAAELLDDLALNILYDENNKGQDPFWEKTSADYFSGLAMGLFEDATEEEVNLNSISLMTTVGEEKLANTTYIKEYFSFKDPTSNAYINASSTIMAPNDTRASILSVFKQKIKLFASRENISEMLANNDFDMRDIGKKKTAVFIVIQDEKKTYHSLVTIFLKQCYETLISVAQENGGKLKYRTNFILDEFANMPPLKDVTTMVTAARSRNIRFTFIIQNFAQLYEVYGKENGETIKGNCGNIIYLISTELSALEEISKMCGEVKSKEKEKTSSTPLVTVSDLQRLDQWETIILRLRTMPFKTKLTPNFQMDWGHHFPKASYPQRQKQPIKVFDLKKYVEAKREEKINSMLNGSDSPFGGRGMPGMPGMPGLPGMPGMPGMPSSRHTETPFGGPKRDSKPPIDVDDLVKRIDAKIAELEAEEEAERKKSKEQVKVDKKPVEEKKEEKVIPVQKPVTPKKEVVEAPKPVQTKVELKPQPKPEVKVEEKPKVEDNKEGITEDQFFDDFFNDE